MLLQYLGITSRLPAHQGSVVVEEGNRQRRPGRDVGAVELFVVLFLADAQQLGGGVRIGSEELALLGVELLEHRELARVGSATGDGSEGPRDAVVDRRT